MMTFPLGLSMRARVMAGFVLVAAVAISNGFVMWQVRGATNEAEAELRGATQSLSDVYATTIAIREAQGMQRAYLITGGADILAAYVDQMRFIDGSFTYAIEGTTSSEARERWLRVRDMVREWHRETEVMRQLRRANDPRAASMFEEISLPRAAPILQQLRSIERGRELALNRAEANLAREITVATWLSLISGVITVVLLGLLLLAIKKRLLNPLAELSACAARMTDGNYGARLPAETHDEMGTLVRAFSGLQLAIVTREHAVKALWQQAESERERLRLIVDMMPVGVVIVEPPLGRTVTQNRVAQEILGEASTLPETLLLDQPFELRSKQGAVVPPDEWPLARALAGDVVDTIEQHLCVPGQPPRPVLVSAAPIRDEFGEVASAVITFQDISRLHEVDRMKTEFISVVSHELRTPLTSIKGALQLALDDLRAGVQGEPEDLLDVALNNCDRLIRIINDILDVSKIEAGRLTLQARPAAVADLVATSVESVATMARAARIGIDVTIAPDVPQARVDPDRIVQVLVNLLSNALKFAPADSTVDIRARTTPRGLIEISVADKGPGIPPESIGRLFNKFVQVDGSATRRAGGTGLGLAITKGIVDQHGGEIQVVSPAEGGTVFKFTVPAVRASVETPRDRRRLDAEPLVLVVDDDDYVRTVLQEVLERAGYSVIEAADGETAIALAASALPSLILLDLLMPGMDGWTVLRELSANSATADIPVLVVSGADEKGELDRSVQVLEKPIDPEALLAQIRVLTTTGVAGRVLVADDDPELRTILDRALSRHGFRVHSVGDGADALETIKTSAVDLLVIDLAMPEIDGLAVIRAVRASDSQIPILVISGTDASRGRRQSLQLGANVYLTKPIEIASVVREVQRLIGKPSRAA
jgi:signal transduction histidine kinase/CheY-like chemotaxis protein/CHASE3 domain sensor protein